LSAIAEPISHAGRLGAKRNRRTEVSCIAAVSGGPSMAVGIYNSAHDSLFYREEQFGLSMTNQLSSCYGRHCWLRQSLHVSHESVQVASIYWNAQFLAAGMDVD
jgi:hypothetical protein